jgi:hypothetical protein
MSTFRAGGSSGWSLHGPQWLGRLVKQSSVELFGEPDFEAVTVV